MGKVLLALVIVLVSTLLVIYVYNRIKIKQEEPLLANPLGQMVEVELPYDGAKEMLLVDDIDNREFLRTLLEAMYDE